MKIFSDTAEEVLVRAGWTPDRDVSGDLVFSEQKVLFKQANWLINNLGLLKLTFAGRGGVQTLYFDVDDSEISKNMRAETFGCNSYLDPSLKNEPDFEPLENFKWVMKAEEYVDTRLCRVGYLEDEFGFDVYVGENGYIYLAHGEEPILKSLNYIDFLNSLILSSKI